MPFRGFPGFIAVKNGYVHEYAGFFCKKVHYHYLNGIGIYGVCYFCALLLAFAVGGVLGAFSVKTILFGLGGFLCNMLFFTAVYNLSIMAVMLTGNVLVTLMGCSVFLLYEYMIRFLMDGMQSAFFRTYCSFGNTTSNSWTSPVFTYLNGISDMSSYLWGNGSRYMVSFLEKLAVIAVQALVYGIAAYVLYRKRKAEAAGMAMAFTKSKSVIKLLLMIPVTLLAGLWFRGLSGDSVFFTVLGMLIGLLLSHGLIQIIYEFDIHSVLNKNGIFLLQELPQPRYSLPYILILPDMTHIYRKRMKLPAWRLPSGRIFMASAIMKGCLKKHLLQQS